MEDGIVARIRSIHPGQWTDEDFVSVSAFARLLALGVRNEADDQGIFEWKPTTLKMRLLPADNVDVVALLSELERANIIKRYSAEGREYGAIRNFKRYQRPKKPNSLHPIPAEFRTYLGSPDDSSEPVENRYGNQPADVGGRREDGGGSKTPPQASPSVGERASPSAQPPTPVEPEVEKPPKATRGSRLPSDWTLPEDWRAWATDELFGAGVTLAAANPWIDRRAEGFRDFWVAKAGKDGVKLDWEATWRNWIRRDIDDGKAPKAGKGANEQADEANSQRSAERVAAVVARLAGKPEPGLGRLPGGDAGAVLPAVPGG